jgi:hypothetical protein
MTAANQQIVTEQHMRVDAASSDPKKVLTVVANPHRYHGRVAGQVLGRRAHPPLLRTE